MDMREAFRHAPKKTLIETYGEGSDAFEVELRLCSRADTEKIGRMQRRVRDKTGAWHDEPDLDKVRKYLQEQCIVSWKGLTVGTFFRLCNTEMANGQREQADVSVECSPGNVLLLMEECIGTDPGTGFVDWVLNTVSRRAEEHERDLSAEKKISATTSAATSST